MSYIPISTEAIEAEIEAHKKQHSRCFDLAPTDVSERLEYFTYLTSYLSSTASAESFESAIDRALRIMKQRPKP